MAKNATEQREAMLVKNTKAIDSIDLKIAKVGTDNTEKVEKAEAVLKQRQEALNKAEVRLATLKNASKELKVERQRLEQERNWILSMPVDATSVQGSDEVFNEDGNFGTEGDLDDDDDAPVSSPGPMPVSAY